ncbi:MAG: hypothetical protein D6791_18410 [Chloroflexi bacterium]|nr:MAG: hypothetical protein D6791_18410 [Chloroflexota bacterium]
MASSQHTQPIQIQPQPIPSDRERRRRRHRLLKAVILLTVPFYCAGFTLLAMLQVEAIVNRVASSPMFLGGLVFFIFLLLAEPWTGMMTHSCAAGVKCASVGAGDPVSCLGCMGSCLTVVGVVAGMAALVAWLL